MLSELNDNEKDVLKIMFSQFEELLDVTSYINLENGEYFDRNDLFSLAEKIGIDF